MGNGFSRAAACCVWSVLLGAPALAQQVDDSQRSDSEEASTLNDEILVTATKHGLRYVQDVPAAITAFGATQLDELNFDSLLTLATTMPNVSLEQNLGPANYTIRGQGINSSIPSIDPTVGVFVDGVYMGTTWGVNSSNFDLEAVEVLRGPQGVLFGRNVTGGAILLRTTTPSEETIRTGHMALESGLRDTGLRYVGDAVMSGPLVDGQVYGKLAAYYSHDDGWFRNAATGANLGRGESWIFRPAVRFTPSSDLEVIIRLEHGRENGEATPVQNLLQHNPESFDVSINEEGFAHTRYSQAILESNWNVGFGDGSVTAILGYREIEQETLADLDGTNRAGGFTTGFNALVAMDQDQVSGELRYAGTFGDFDVTTGIYYFQQDIFYTETRVQLDGAPRNGGGIADFSTWAAFASTDWHVTPTVTLNAGLRYSHEEKSAATSHLRAGGIAANGTLNISFSDEDSWNSLSPRLGLQWEPAETVNLYAYWAQATRSGGYNLRTSSSAIAAGPFDDETQDTYEIGAKLDDLFGGRGTLNFAVFHNTIEDIQRQVLLPGSVQIITNAGDVVVRGFELEGRYSLTDRLLVSAHAGYLDDEYQTVSYDLNQDGLVNAADAALHLPRLSPWTYGVSASYNNVPIGDWGYLDSRISYNYRDEAAFNDSNSLFVHELNIVDANVTLSPARGAWEVSLYGRNLLNEVPQGLLTSLGSNAAFGGSNAQIVGLGRGRVVGLEARLDF